MDDKINKKAIINENTIAFNYYTGRVNIAKALVNAQKKNKNDNHNYIWKTAPDINNQD